MQLLEFAAQFGAQFRVEIRAVARQTKKHVRFTHDRAANRDSRCAVVRPIIAPACCLSSGRVAASPEARATRRAISAFGVPLIRNANDRLRSTLIVGYNAYDWNTSAMRRSFGSAHVMSSPAISMLPSVTSIRPRDAVKQRRFTAAGRPEQYDEFARLNVEIEVFDHGIRAEPDNQIAHRDVCGVRDVLLATPGASLLRGTRFPADWSAHLSLSAARMSSPYPLTAPDAMPRTNQRPEMKYTASGTSEVRMVAAMLTL